MKTYTSALRSLALAMMAHSSTNAFSITTSAPVKQSSNTQLQMGLDAVTSLRTEWISASICTNQIPMTAKSVLQLGTDDGRAVNFVPRTVEEIFTSSAEADGELSIACRRQLKQQRDRRGTGAVIRYLDQPCDHLKEMKDNSVDCVISLQAAQRMADNGQDWKKSISEANRVLKPEGYLVFVEQTEIGGVKYMDAIAEIAESNTDEEGNLTTWPLWELRGYDDVDLVIVPHIAGVVKKPEFAGLTQEQIENKSANDKKDRMADLSLDVFERGLKKRRKKKKKKGMANEEEE
jgi:ubiquinone/menaquinone biosynthesis C-methylase UbiE